MPTVPMGFVRPRDPPSWPLCLAFFNAQPVFFEGGDARAVVAAVFKPLEAVNEDGVRGLRSEVSYNATHERLVKLWLAAKSQFQTGGVVDGCRSTRH